MKHAAVGGAILFALAVALSAYPVRAEMPTVGHVAIPTARLICFPEEALPAIFDGTTDINVIRERIAAVKAIFIGNLPTCAFVSFGKPVTVVRVVEVGRVVFSGDKSSIAYSVTIRFPDGDEVFALWLEQVKGEGV